MTEQAFNNPWSIRRRELDQTLPLQIPTPDEIEAVKLDLLQEVTFSSLAEAEAADDFVHICASVLEDPESLSAYAGAQARHARVSSILAAEGFTPPVTE